MTCSNSASFKVKVAAGLATASNAFCDSFCTFVLEKTSKLSTSPTQLHLLWHPSHRRREQTEESFDRREQTEETSTEESRQKRAELRQKRADRRELRQKRADRREHRRREQTEESFDRRELHPLHRRIEALFCLRDCVCVRRGGRRRRSVCVQLVRG
jgi:hypothetical protein